MKNSQIFCIFCGKSYKNGEPYCLHYNKLKRNSIEDLKLKNSELRSMLMRVIGAKNKKDLSKILENIESIKVEINEKFLVKIVDLLRKKP